MDNKTLGKWAYILGALLAIVAAFVDLGEGIVTPVLILLGVVAGLLSITDDKFAHKVILYLGLAATAGTVSAFVAVGGFITTVVEAYVGFLGPVVLAASLKAGYSMYRN